ncbi:MAG: parvulin peptidyl-prolyl isomerase [Candidatus Kapabacteria bacterium]|nr:parvulin peptidyl-prolyl isomerase [Candidatus Kapabacteria bacterium]
MTTVCVRTPILVALILLSGGLMVRAQDAMEAIVAVVGREIILQSDIAGQVEAMAQRDPRVNRKDADLRRAILDQLINEKLVLTRAQEDTTIEITDEDISSRMDYQIQMLVQQFGSEKRIEDVYGMSISKIKKDFREEIRKRLYIERIQQKMFTDVKVSRTDVENFYAKYKDSIPKISERVDLYHIVKYVKASDEDSKQAQQLALRIRDSVAVGGSFSDFARRYSGDVASAANGGDLGTVEKGKFVPTFEAAAFALEANEISQPVESPFGWHIIQLISKTSSSITSRHILIKVGQSDKDRKAATDDLLALKARVAAGENFEDLARKVSDERETQGFGGAMGLVELERLPGEMRSIITALPDGGVSDPLPYAADPTKPGYHILYRKRLVPEHAPTIANDYKQLEQLALMEKRQRLERDWIADLRKKLYWEVR